MQLSQTTAGQNQAKPGPWLALGLPANVAEALADAINAVAEQRRHVRSFNRNVKKLKLAYRRGEVREEDILRLIEVSVENP